MVLTTPGLTTTYEALVYNIPIRFLPPQNYSQALMLKHYRNTGFADISFDWTDVYNESIVPLYLPEKRELN